jgi:adenylate cyclase
MTAKDRPDATEVVDLSLDPREARAERRRRLARVILPILGAILLIGATLGTIVIGHVTNRGDALVLADAVLQSLEKRIVTEIENWLGPAERAVRLLHEAEKRGAVQRGPQLVEPLSMAVLSSVPHVAIVSVADRDGNYFMFRRNPSGGIDSKIITVGPPRHVVNIIRDADGSVVRTFEDPEDRFDPRTRPWFTGALEHDGVHWTEMYVFFTDRVPGLTVSAAVREESGELRAVFGADIRLDALSAFLGQLSIGTTGKAMIIDRRGTLVAFPDAHRTIKQVGDSLSPVRVDELDDPVLTRAFNVFRVEGPGRRTIEVGRERHLTIAAPVPNIIGNDWSVLIVVPEDEFIGFVSENSRLSLIAASVVVLLAILLTVTLVRQGLRADRSVRLLRQRSRAVTAQSDAFATIAADAGLLDSASEKATHRLTETVARTLQARRVSLWRFDSTLSTLRCEDVFDAESNVHSLGVQLRRDELPHAFDALAAAPLDTPDAAQDPRVAALYRVYLQPVGGRALMSVPIQRAGATLGLLWVEDRAAGIDGALAFATAAANMLALRMAPLATTRRQEPARIAASDGGTQTSTRHSMPGDGFLGADRGRLFTERLARRNVGERGFPAEVFRDVTVLVLRFSDPLALAERAPDEDGSPLADHAVRIVQDVATMHGIDYLRVLAESVVAADGFATGAERAIALASAALDLQERLSALFHSADHRLGFRIGLDTGPVIGSVVGDTARTYNIWGEAVRMATAMAESCPETVIHVTETTADLIRDAFLMRPRGRFWLEGVGEMSTFMLAARA